ncbi:MAG: hypothetical protein MMC33_003812 [Icmadophila ericetorum]|nr:hypothetical protein [Icmadophila ericetorum]
MDSEEAWFTIPLEQTGDGAFHIKRTAANQLNARILDSHLLDVFHGHAAPGKEPATLLVVDFRFLSPSQERRFKQAEIELQFEDEGRRSTQDPEVAGIAPNGDFPLNPTSRIVTTTLSGGVSVMAGGTIASARVGIGWDRSTTTERTDRGTVMGHTKVKGRAFGKMNVARFMMRENSSQQDRIPSRLRIAILLKRCSKEDRFLIIAEIKTKVDVRHSLNRIVQNWRGTAVKSDYILFDPGVTSGKPTGPGVDCENLATCDLKSLSYFVPRTQSEADMGEERASGKN